MTNVGLYDAYRNLNNYKEGSNNRNFWNEILNERLSLITTLTNSNTPFSDEIVKKILNQEGFNNIISSIQNIGDKWLATKALLLDGVKFILSMDENSEKELKEYFLGLFYVLNIDIKDKSFLKILKEELEKESLPESPIYNILGQIMYDREKK